MKDFKPPHLLIGDVLHCPINRASNRGVGPLPSDSHRYNCPSCGARLRFKNQPITRELEEIPQ